MLQCRPGTVKKAVFVTVPGLQRTMSGARRRAQTAHAALRPGHTTDSLILGQTLTFCERKDRLLPVRSRDHARARNIKPLSSWWVTISPFITKDDFQR